MLDVRSAAAAPLELRFPIGYGARKRLLPHGSEIAPVFPAKMSLGLLSHLVERYTCAGDVVLDPFAGCGTTMLAALEGRHVVLVELEPQWVEACRKNAEHLAASLTPPTGTIVVRQGDSRRDLAGVVADSVDVVLTSPPYHDDIGRAGRTHSATHYLDRMNGGRVIEAQHQGYAPPAPAPAVDAIVTSPPYVDRYAYRDPETRQAGDPTAGVKGRIHRPYSQNPANIGNLRRYGALSGGAAAAAPGTYLDAMRLVYGQCFAALRPGGTLVAVVGNVVRAGAEVRLDLDTARLLEAAGFVVREILVHRKRPSFFRNLTRQRKPDLPVIDCERVLVAEKPAGGSD